tara:strand:- start:1071 stop:1868 length:798 start_codon:yes stop_codon:yes gene_type:complete
MAIPLAGALMPFLAKAGSAKALPWVLRGAGALGGAAPGLMRGDLGSAVLGGGLGAASTLGLGGLAGAGTKAASGAIFNQAAKAGLSPMTTGVLQGAAQAGIPLAGGLLAGRIGGGMLGGPVAGGANRLMGAGSTIVGYNVNGEPITAAGAAVPGGLGQFGGTNMYGSSPYDVIDPAGAMAANRLMQRKQAQLTADNINTIAPTQLKWTEETKRRDLERQLAAAGIRQNIATQAGMLQAAQQAGLNQGTTALQQVGGALTNNYSYS